MSALGRGLGDGESRLTLPVAGTVASNVSFQLPSFFVVGPPRTGTTWIHHVLQKRANLPAPTKETRFFDCHFHRGLKWYSHHFPAVHSDRPTGEIAPTYFASAHARDFIAQTNPYAKLVFVFREPVQRVISLYRVKRAYGLLRWSFEEALERDPELLATGMHATHLKRWRETFPLEQMLVSFYEELRQTPQAYIDRLLTFLAIPHSPLTATDLTRVHASERMTQPRNFLVTRTATTLADWCKARNLDNLVASVRKSRLMRLCLGGGAPFPEISESTLKMLSELFRPEVEDLQSITGRDLSLWMQPHQHAARNAQAEARQSAACGN